MEMLTGTNVGSDHGPADVAKAYQSGFVVVGDTVQTSVPKVRPLWSRGSMISSIPVSGLPGVELAQAKAPKITVSMPTSASFVLIVHFLPAGLRGYPNFSSQASGSILLMVKPLETDTLLQILLEGSSRIISSVMQQFSSDAMMFAFSSSLGSADIATSIPAEQCVLTHLDPTHLSCLMRGRTGKEPQPKILSRSRHSSSKHRASIVLIIELSTLFTRDNDTLAVFILIPPPSCRGIVNCALILSYFCTIGNKYRLPNKKTTRAGMPQVGWCAMMHERAHLGRYGSSAVTISAMVSGGQSRSSPS